MWNALRAELIYFRPWIFGGLGIAGLPGELELIWRAAAYGWVNSFIRNLCARAFSFLRSNRKTADRSAYSEAGHALSVSISSH